MVIILISHESRNVYFYAFHQKVQRVQKNKFFEVLVNFHAEILLLLTQFAIEKVERVLNINEKTGIEY